MIYAIGDIHGQLGQLDEALRLIEQDGGRAARVVFLGDYTDRGPDSRGVIERLIEGVEAGRNWTVLRGNHDRMFARFVRYGSATDARISSGNTWLHPTLGGTTTLASYGVFAEAQSGQDEIVQAARRAVPETHLDFLDSRPLWHETDDQIFVHAGIRPGIEMTRQEEDDLIWIRKGWLEDPRDHGKLIVHGHTALDFPCHYGNRLNLDGGAGFGRPLIPAVIEGRDCWLLTGNGRVQLMPIGTGF